jgi:hypothetical protein
VGHCFKMCCSVVVTGSARLVTGGMPVGSLGLFMQFTVIIKSLIGVINRSRSREKAVLPSPPGRIRDDERSNLSPRNNQTVRILPCPDEDLFQALADEITA